MRVRVPALEMALLLPFLAQQAAAGAMQIQLSCADHQVCISI